MPAQSNPIAWFEIHVSDMDRACQFYSTVFNQSFSQIPSAEPTMETRIFSGNMSSYGATVALVKHPSKSPSTEGVLVYFSCDDCLIEQESALTNGGCIFKPKFSIGTNGFISIIGDTEGNAIGLHSFK
jgi:predicted enzyme related to lactoylglutathione lyase